MKIPYKHLAQYIKSDTDINHLSEKLFQLGHEHEIFDEIFDMEFTPNRGDCLSLHGLLRDLRVFYNIDFNKNIYEKDIKPFSFEFLNDAKDACSNISFLKLEIDEIPKNYKKPLEDYFTDLKIKKINFFTDISNYISYERGLPTHCFDRESITQGFAFINRSCEENFKTLLGDEIELQGKNCVFTIGEEVISIAGVMGGDSTACSSNTKKVLVECAYFNPEEIIGKTIKYNLKSEAAYKFERGVDISLQETVLRRFISIVQDHAQIKNLRFKTFLGGEIKEKFLPIKTESINKILGTNITKEEYINYLSKLGFEIEDKIKIPSFRHDINTQNDLSEEIARIIGYDNINSIPIKLSTDTKQEHNKVSSIKDFFVENGFSEVINFPFSEKEEKESILIDNPLDSNKKNLRTSLKDSLLENLLFNERRQKDSIKLFEISDVYKNDINIIQEKRLGIIISGRQGHNYIDFQKKLDNEYLNKILNINNDVSIFNVEEISRANLKTKKKEKIFYTEVLIDDIPDEFFKSLDSKENLINFVKYVPVSEFPSSIRDFSFSIKHLEQYNKFISYIEDFQDDNLKDFFIFDFYMNEKLREIKVGIRLIFQSNENTLTDLEIQKSTKKLLEPLCNLEGVSIPGLENFT